MAGAAARRRDHGRVRTMSNKEVLPFWKLAPCDVEARVRRLEWAQTLAQDPAHHTQLITAMFGKLLSESNPTLGPGGEIASEANQWAVRWMADLEELEPYDERESRSAYGSGREGSLPGSRIGGRFRRNGRHDSKIAVVGCRGPTVGFSGRGGSHNGIVGGRSSTMEVLFRRTV